MSNDGVLKEIHFNSEYGTSPLKYLTNNDVLYVNSVSSEVRLNDIREWRLRVFFGDNELKTSTVFWLQNRKHLASPIPGHPVRTL